MCRPGGGFLHLPSGHAVCDGITDAAAINQGAVTFAIQPKRFSAQQAPIFIPGPSSTATSDL
ncbi:hypothetical protein PT2222_220148 [Paraburkholderia tropica]